MKSMITNPSMDPSTSREIEFPPIEVDTSIANEVAVEKVEGRASLQRTPDVSSIHRSGEIRVRGAAEDDSSLPIQ